MRFWQGTRSSNEVSLAGRALQLSSRDAACLQGGRCAHTGHLQERCLFVGRGEQAPQALGGRAAGRHGLVHRRDRRLQVLLQPLQLRQPPRVRRLAKALLACAPPGRLSSSVRLRAGPGTRRGLASERAAQRPAPFGCRRRLAAHPHQRLQRRRPAAGHLQDCSQPGPRRGGCCCSPWQGCAGA
jgi:hypothetical protein